MNGRDTSGSEKRRHQEEVTRAIMSEDAFSYYRGLIGQIEIAMPQLDSKALLLSSSSDGEGTTEVLVGLGLTLAASMGRRTAIVDCNAKHPDIHERFGVQDIGLDEYLKGTLPIEQALVNTTVPNLHVMALGSGITSLAGISKVDLQRFISTLKDRFDYVLIDSAAVGVNPETTILCDIVDGTILVVRHGSTRREIVRRAKDMVERAGGKILGVVLNKRRFPIPEFLYRRL
jgi:capsular exopolysaccharide synthesis family protein